MTHSRDLGLKELRGEQWVVAQDYGGLLAKRRNPDRENRIHTTSVLIDFSSADERHCVGLRSSADTGMRGTDRRVERGRMKKKKGEKRERRAFYRRNPEQSINSSKADKQLQAN